MEICGFSTSKQSQEIIHNLPTAVDSSRIDFVSKLNVTQPLSPEALNVRNDAANKVGSDVMCLENNVTPSEEVNCDTKIECRTENQIHTNEEGNPYSQDVSFEKSVKMPEGHGCDKDYNVAGNNVEEVHPAGMCEKRVNASEHVLNTETASELRDVQNTSLISNVPELVSAAPLVVEDIKTVPERISDTKIVNECESEKVDSKAANEPAVMGQVESLNALQIGNQVENITITKAAGEVNTNVPIFVTENISNIQSKEPASEAMSAYETDAEKYINISEVGSTNLSNVSNFTAAGMVSDQSIVASETVAETALNTSEVSSTKHSDLIDALMVNELSSEIVTAEMTVGSNLVCDAVDEKTVDPPKASSMDVSNESDFTASGMSDNASEVVTAVMEAVFRVVCDKIAEKSVNSINIDSTLISELSNNATAEIVSETSQILAENDVVNECNFVPAEIANDNTKVAEGTNRLKDVAAETANVPEVSSSMLANEFAIMSMVAPEVIMSDTLNISEVCISESDTNTVHVVCDTEAPTVLDGSDVNIPKDKSAAMDVNDDEIVITDVICADASHLCSTCGQIFATPRSLALHQNSNACFEDSLSDAETLDVGTNQQKNYQCDYCGRFFTFLWGLDEHINAHIRKLMKVKVLVGTVPQVVTQNDTEDLIVREMLQFSSLGEYMCKKCGRCFASLSEMMTHARRHLPQEMLIDNPTVSSTTRTNGRPGRKVYKWVSETLRQYGSTNNRFSFAVRCSFCQIPIGSVHSLVKHVPQCHRLGQTLSVLQPPPKVDVPLSAQKYVSPHISKEAYPFVCECQQQFQHLWILQQHLQLHLNRGEMTPVHAAVVMRQNKSALALSLDNNDPTQLTSVKSGAQCSACGKVFSSIGLLKVHKEKVHSLTRLTWTECCSTSLTIGGYFQCKECPALLQGSEQFRHHVAGHAENKLNVFLRYKLQLKKALNCTESDTLPSHGDIGEPRVAVITLPDPASNNCLYCGATFDSRTLCMLHMQKFCQKNPCMSAGMRAVPLVPSSGANRFSIEEEKLQQLAERVSGGAQSEDETYACKHCEIVCTSLLAYSRHFEQHIKGTKVPAEVKRVFVCLICNQRLATQFQYNAHMETHQAQKSVCEGCYRVFHSSYPLQKQQNGRSLCMKCVALINKSNFATVGQHSGGQVRVVPQQIIPTVNYISVPPVKVTDTSGLTAKQNSVNAYKLNTSSRPNVQFDGYDTRVVYRKPDGKLFVDEEERVGFESVLQKLGFSMNGTDTQTLQKSNPTDTQPLLKSNLSVTQTQQRTNSTVTPTTSVIDVCDSSNEETLATDELPDGDLSDGNDEFMPTDFLSIEMPTTDTNDEEVILQDVERGDEVQISQEHAYASHAVNQSEAPCLLYTAPAFPSYLQTPVLLANNPTPLLSQLLTSRPTQPNNSRPLQYVNANGLPQPQLPVRMQVLQKNAQTYDLTNWHLDYYNGSWILKNSYQNPTSRGHQQKSRKQAKKSSLASKISTKLSNLLLNRKGNSQKNLGSIASMYGLRECSVVLERLDLKNMPKMYSQVSRCNAPSKVSKRVTSTKSKTPKTVGSMCIPRLENTTSRTVKTLVSPSHISGEKNRPQHAAGTSFDNRSFSNSDNVTGRTSPDCLIILEKKNGVIVTPSQKTTPSLTRKRTPSDSIHLGSKEKTVVTGKSTPVRLTPCKVQLKKLAGETSFDQTFQSCAKRLKLDEVPSVKRNTTRIKNSANPSTDSRTASYPSTRYVSPSTNRGCFKINQLTRPCKVMLEKLNPCLIRAKRIHVDSFKPVNKAPAAKQWGSSNLDLGMKLTETRANRTATPLLTLGNKHETVSNIQFSASVDRGLDAETADVDCCAVSSPENSTVTTPYPISDTDSTSTVKPQLNMKTVSVNTVSGDSNVAAQKLASSYKLNDCMVILHRLDTYLSRNHINI